MTQDSQILKRLRCLDLFCCEGGAAMGLHRAGFDVEGVDIVPQPRYPFKFHLADALSFDLSQYDFIWASPPCQANLNGWNAVNRKRGREVNHVDLIPQTRARLQAAGIPYIMENVPNARLHFPVRLCGSSFRLPIRRHRLFESSHALMVLPCNHSWQREAKYYSRSPPRRDGTRSLSTVVQVYGKTRDSHLWAEAMGIDWMSKSGLTQAIPPAYSEFLGNQIMAYLRSMRGETAA